MLRACRIVSAPADRRRRAALQTASTDSTGDSSRCRRLRALRRRASRPTMASTRQSRPHDRPTMRRSRQRLQRTRRPQRLLRLASRLRLEPSGRIKRSSRVRRPLSIGHLTSQSSTTASLSSCLRSRHASSSLRWTRRCVVGPAHWTAADTRRSWPSPSQARVARLTIALTVSDILQSLGPGSGSGYSWIGTACP